MTIKLVRKIRLGSTNQTHSLSALLPSRRHSVCRDAHPGMESDGEKKAISTCSMPRNKAFPLERWSAMHFRHPRLEVVTGLMLQFVANATPDPYK